MIDTHCHLIDPQFQNDIDSVIKRAKESGVGIIINIGYDLKTSQMAIEMNKKYTWLLPAVGIHPNETALQSLEKFFELEKLLEETSVVAIGETGLDYYRDFSPKDAQQKLFRSHIAIARRYQLPLIIHTRNSIDDAIRILKEEGYFQGVFHCYSGTIEQAKKIIEIGFYLGFGGVLTFSKKVREVFRHLPLKHIVFETDAPFLAPAGHRGRRNEPSYIFETLQVAAGILGMRVNELEEIADRNAKRLFRIK
uniref:TatD family deoxyribonuclease n=1 Tax=candidate division WOR-3 bacterium TaxID=2052148 RepID=A0A7C4XMC5_UNCW3